jgi:hypothetical protein
MTPSRPRRRWRILGALALAVLAAAGCASVGAESTSAFGAFSASTLQLRDGADASLGVVQERIRDRYVAEASAGDVTRVESLLLGPSPGDPFGWSNEQAPLFLKVARFRDGVRRLNSVLVGYAGILEQMGSPALVSPQTYDQLATDLNGNLKTALASMGVAAPPSRELAIFSTVASGSFKAYVQSKQRGTLLKALQENQPAIDDVAQQGVAAVRITALAYRNEYDLASQKLAQKKAIRELAELDDRFIKDMAGLRTLSHSYQTLPGAHRELAAGQGDPAFGLPMIRELYENGRELYRQYEQLNADDRRKK